MSRFFGDGSTDGNEIEKQTDPLDPDTDGDGTLTDGSTSTRFGESRDRDRDGIGDTEDPDDDNDGVNDIDEITKGTDPYDPDSDDDGLVMDKNLIEKPIPTFPTLMEMALTTRKMLSP